MNRRKLLVLLSPEGDAAARDVAENCARLGDAYEITVLATRERRRAFEALGVGFVPFRPSGIFGMGASISTLRKAATRLGPDVIHVHGFPAASVSLGTFPSSLAKRTIVTFHDPMREGELPKRLVERKLPGYLRRAKTITATYDSLAASLRRRFAFDDDAIAVIPHGVDVPPGDAPLVRPTGRPGPILGWSGALAADRAWEVAVDALARTRERFPDARLLLAGDGRARQFVNAYVRTNGLAPYVTFLGAVEPQAIFTNIDVLLVPISRDAQPQALLEALVWGVPAVAANGGALAEAVGAMETGWLVDDDAVSFANGAEAAWSHIDTAFAGAAAQRATARERYDREHIVASYRKIYESITDD
jgi:glycosyltransferase involved in cell wall biosynthesis